MSFSFSGKHYRLPTNWFSTIPLDEYKNIPIKYLEIGAFYGANLLSVAETYGNHPDSRLYSIDPWLDYDDYDEYRTLQDGIYKTFCENIDLYKDKHKIEVIRGFSNNEVHKFENDFFDMIYIDGNHETEYVLEDAVLSFRKLKKGGILIFDDYDWKGVKKGVDAFTECYNSKIEKLGIRDEQVFFRKL